MKYTIQLHTDSTIFRLPEGTDVVHVTGKANIRRKLQSWHDTVNRYSEGECSALIWKGTIDDVTDIYPTAEASFGARCGFRIESI